jgi:long-chain fatty acid transport protein
MALHANVRGAMWKRFLLLFAHVLLAAISPAFAGGLFLYEVGTPDMGFASAGWAARADDAATVLTNPAGMTRLDEGDLLLGLQALYGDVGFTPNANTSTSGGDGGNPVGWFPGGGAFWVHPVSDRLRFGLAVTGNFGLGLDYDDDWAGRYYVQDGTTLGISVLPAIAWKASDTVSIGAALNATYGIFDTKVAVNNPLPSDADGSLALDDTTWGLGGNVGILFEPNEATRVGLTYTSPVELDFAAMPEFSGLSTGLSTVLGTAGLLESEIDLAITVPQTVTASFVRGLGGGWSLLGNVGWQDWSAFGKVDVVVASDDPTSLTADLNFQDTWQAALGAERKIADGWTWSFGAAYDSSCLDDADRTPTLPLGESWRFGAGARRKLGEKLHLGLAYTLLWGGTLPVDQERGPLAGRIAGAYSDTTMHFLGGSLRWTL